MLENPIAVRGDVKLERLSSKQVAIIDDVGSSLVPPATDDEFLDVRIAMNDGAGSIGEFMELFVGRQNSEQALLVATKITASIAYAALRMESEG